MTTPTIRIKQDKDIDYSLSNLGMRLTDALVGEFVDEKSKQIARNIIQETLDYEGLNLQFEVHPDIDNRDLIINWTMNDKNSSDFKKLESKCYPGGIVNG